MSQSPLEAIKTAEKEAQHIVEDARQQAQTMVKKAHEAGNDKLTNLPNTLEPELNDIIAETKVLMQSELTQLEHDMDKKMKQIERIDAQTIDTAAQALVKHITTS